MKKHTLRFAALLSLLLSLLILAGCGGTETDGAEITTEAPATGPALYENGSFAYSIIRSEDAGSELVAKCSELYKKLSELSGESLSFTDDFVIPGKEPAADAKEILIGCTNRTESTEKYAELLAGDWFVGVSGSKILIIGGSDSATVAAIDAFMPLLDGLFDGTQNVVLNSLAEPITHSETYSCAVNTICGTSLKEYTCRYASKNSDVTQAVASAVSEGTGALNGVAFPVKLYSKKETEHNIYIGNADEQSAAFAEEAKKTNSSLGWCIAEKDGNLYLAATDDWGLRAGAEALVQVFAENADIPSGFIKTGTAAGEYIFPKTDGSNLRIMTNNVWDCDSNQAAWKEIGANCSAATRSIGFAKVYAAYMPDVICFQEMSSMMIGYIRSNLRGYGINYKLLAVSTQSTDNTCILYNPETVTLEDSGHHLYTYGNNSNSKSYTWGYFKLNSTGEHFIALSTHLWWKSESDQAGSNQWRTDQAAEIVALSETLIAKYNCPMFIQGDLNCSCSSTAYQTLLSGGFEDDHDIAASKDNLRGHHQCSSSGYSTEMYAGTYNENAIDHMLVKNKGESKILNFRHIVADFYYCLSDHFPVYVDVALNSAS